MIKYDDKYYYDIVRKNIRKYRKEKKLTQQKLAELTGFSTDYIGEIESLKKGKSFSIALVGRIANATNKEIKCFFEEKESIVDDDKK